MKDEFLAVLSHELRTPLHAIVGYTRLMRMGALAGPKLSDAVEAIERNSKLLGQMIDDVLDVSRIVAGKTRLDVQPIELPLVIHNAVSTVQPAADAKGVRIEAWSTRAPAWCRAIRPACSRSSGTCSPTP